MNCVVDSSAVAGWLLDEPEALLLEARWRGANGCAPFLLLAETGQAILRAVRRGRISDQDKADEAWSALRDLALEFVTELDLGPSALRIGQTRGLSFYDALFVALAAERRLPLVTLDDRQAAAARAEGIEVIA